MKPTMPMNAFPPGGPPGVPPSGGGHGSGGGWGPPSGGGYGSSGGGYNSPPGPPGGAPPAKKSKAGLFIGLGCGCFALLGCVAAAVGIPMFIASSVGPGEEVASGDVILGQPFALSYAQTGSQRYSAWLEVDVSYSSGYRLSGNALLSENGTPFGQYTIDDTGSGSAVTERSSGTRVPWTYSDVNGSGSARGTVSLFPIPARSDGTTITVSGTINGSPGTTGTVRLIIAERD